MTLTKKNHINPQSLLEFWEHNGKLNCFNKISGKTLANMTTENVCFEKHFLSQNLENEFSQIPDAFIGSTIKSIIKNGAISGREKNNIIIFLSYQWLRDPFIRYVIKQSTDAVLLKYIEDKIGLENLIYSSHKMVEGRIYNILHDKKWELLTFADRVLITNEAVCTPELIECSSGNVKYFPITPQHCIILSTDNIKRYPTNEMSSHINGIMERMPTTKWIIYP